MKSLTATIVLFGFCFYLTFYSREHLAPIAVAIIIFAGVLATPLISIWLDGPFLQRQIKAAKIAFSFSAFIFLLGYFYVILKVAI